jgi:tetratricopeptide (TPR) repeat protein
MGRLFSLQILFITCFFISQACYAEFSSEIRALQHRCAEVNYLLMDEEKIPAFKKLIKQAEHVTQQHPDQVESWIWIAIIKASYAGSAGPFDALNSISDAKLAFEKALSIDEKEPAASAYVGLGILYFKAPGWPISFGDNNAADAMFKKAIQINPEGIGSNFQYAEFLYNEGEYMLANQHILKAQVAPVRSGRELEDSFLKKDIEKLRLKIIDELN